MEIKNKDELLYFTIKGFGDRAMDHLFSSRIGWDQEDIFRGIEKIFPVGPGEIYRGTQVHGDKIVLVDKDTNQEDLKTREFDGLITKEPGLALVTYHADCTPLYFYDKEKEVVGLAHAGWRGTYLNMAQRMVEKMSQDFGSDPRHIQVGIGPAICPGCYQVKEDVYGKFQDKYDYENVIEEKGGIVSINIPDINRRQLLGAGVLEENLFVADLCTSCNTDKLFSYRKEGTKGRMIASIILRRR